ncbi:DUF3656 domain-containing U32 family peptidase [Methanolapillus millepedarum]
MSENCGKKKPELLAPAGTLLSLIAGIENGADAIYMGAAKFNARAYAGNFLDEELEIGIDFAHAFGKKVYITLNTLFRDDELEEVAALLNELYQMGADAIIIQDFGFLNLLQKIQPDVSHPIQIHASTQMTVHNSYHAAFLKEKGISRIVPARENNIAELSAIKETGVEVETFIHGALCICYSGQCQFSGAVGGRSGNRGQCAQPCRKKYMLVVDGKAVTTDGKYLISPRDLNASDDLFRLIEAGVDSFKIEGRMKKPEYVAGVVSVYRKLIDRYAAAHENDPSRKNENLKTKSVGPTLDEREILKKLFNRDFTSGYFVKNPKNELMSRKLPYNKGFLIGKITDVDPKRAQISVQLAAALSSQDGISIGDLGKETDGVEDPRQGFVVKKMYVSRKMVSEASPGDTVNILAPVLFEGENNRYMPKAGDSVYKTFDFNLQRNIQKTLPEIPIEDIRLQIESLTLKNKTTDEKDDAIAEFIEKLTPQNPVQIPVRMKCFVCPGFALEISAADKEGNEIKIESDYIVQPAIKNPFSKESAVDMLSKLGPSVYAVLSADAEVIDDCFVPVGVFKETRNKALRALLAARIRKSKPNLKETLLALNETKSVPSQNQISHSLALSISVYTKESVAAALAGGADRIYVGGDVFIDPLTKEKYGLTLSDFKELIAELNASDLEKIYWKMPFVTKEEDFDDLYPTFSTLSELGISGILASNPGVYHFVRTKFGEKFRIATDSAFNIFNSEAAELFLDGGVSSVALSPELSIRNISALSEHLFEKRSEAGELECVVFGRQRLMVTEHPLLEMLLNENKGMKIPKSQKKTGSDIFRYALKDSKDFVFPVLTDSKNRSFIFNSKELNVFDLLPKLKNAGITAFRIDGIGHTEDEILELAARYKKEIERLQNDGKMSGQNESYAGINNKSDNESENEESSDGSQYTRGNFIRGVY